MGVLGVMLSCDAATVPPLSLLVDKPAASACRHRLFCLG